MFSPYSVRLAPILLLLLVTDIQSFYRLVIPFVKKRSTNTILMQTDGPIIVLRQIAPSLKKTTGILSIIMTCALIILLIWGDFGILVDWKESRWKLIVAAVCVSKVYLSVLPRYSADIFDIFFEHLYIDYLYLKYPVTIREPSLPVERIIPEEGMGMDQKDNAK